MTTDHMQFEIVKVLNFSTIFSLACFGYKNLFRHREKMLKILSSFKGLLLNDLRLVNQQSAALIHTSTTLDAKYNAKNRGPVNFLKHNKTIFPPQLPDEKPRPAYVCHIKENIKYSPKNMWYISSFIRGMSIDEALKQLSFVLKKGAGDVKQTLLEAQEMAVKDHNVEFKSNLWVGK